MLLFFNYFFIFNICVLLLLLLFNICVSCTSSVLWFLHSSLNTYVFFCLVAYVVSVCTIGTFYPSVCGTLFFPLSILIQKAFFQFSFFYKGSVVSSAFRSFPLVSKMVIWTCFFTFLSVVTYALLSFLHLSWLDANAYAWLPFYLHLI